MSDDRHAEARERKRHKRRYGHATTNPGMRIVMRELAQADKDAHRLPEDSPASSRRQKRIRIRRRRKTHH